MSPYERFGSRRSRSDDSGFILIMVGLLVIPIVAFTALAVDVSAWYSRATELQRSADAAALAGVVWMPRETDAGSAADKVLTSNGTPASSRITVTKSPGGADNPNAFTVCITDTEAPQFFSGVFTGHTSITRCATAEYNLPLELGSPLNYYGGNSTADFGTTPVTHNTTSTSTTPQSSWNPSLPDNYKTAGPTDGAFRGCKYVYSNGSYYDPGPKGFWWDFAGTRRGGTSTRLDQGTNSRVWQTGSTWHYADELPDCVWTVTVTSTTYEPINPIPAEKSPNFWAAIAGPGMFTFNGDAYAPRCKSSGRCGSNTNSMYRPKGYIYSIDVPTGTTSGDVSVQIFDAAENTGSIVRTGDKNYSNNAPYQQTIFELKDAGVTPYDTSDDTLVPGCSLTTNTESTYNNKWFEMCKFTPTYDRRYYLNVRSENKNANTYNGYALRVVAGTFPADCIKSSLPQLRSVDCYGVDPQPRLAGYGDMEMYNGIPKGVDTNFFLANVLPEYAGRTLVIELWDPGDGATASNVTLMKPDSGSTLGTPQKGCIYRGFDPDNTPGSFTTIGPGSDCTITTSSGGNNAYNGKWVQIKVDLPTGYTCNRNANPVTTAGSCWWQIRYQVTSGQLGDYTTWTARVEGDPVRLTM